MGKLLDTKPNSKNFVYCSTLTKQMFLHIRIIKKKTFKFDFDNENIYFENYYDEQCKFTNESYSI